MRATDPPGVERYHKALILLHWLMLVLIVAVYACIELREFYPRGSAMRSALKEWHYALGLVVFVLVWVRLCVRWVGSTPAIVPPPPQWQAAAAGIVHASLYALMIAMPMLGWLALSAEGKPPTLYGIALPALIAPDRALAETFEHWHETIGVAGYTLLAVHAAAALLHHYVIRDNTLRRMLPRRAWHS